MTYSVACRVRGYGLSEEAAFDLMADHWNDEKAFPPWNPDELRTKVATHIGTQQAHDRGRPDRVCVPVTVPTIEARR